MKIAVVTDPESAVGYRLAGLEVFVPAGTADARELLVDLIRQDAYALIVVSEALLSNPYQAVRREMRGRDVPVLLPAPHVRAVFETEEGEAGEYVRRLIRETMGYDIKL